MLQCLLKQQIVQTVTLPLSDVIVCVLHLPVAGTVNSVISSVDAATDAIVIVNKSATINLLILFPFSKNSS